MDAAASVPESGATTAASTPGAAPPRCVLRTDGRFHVLMQFAAAAVLCAFALLFPRGAAATLGGAMRWLPPLLWLPVFVAGMVLETALHEAAHGLVLRLAGVRVGFGVLVRRHIPLGAYCRPHGPVPRRAMLASLAAPQVLVPAVLLPLGTALGRGPLSLAVLYCVLNVAGSVGDAAFLGAILARPAAAAYTDEDEGLFAAGDGSQSGPPPGSKAVAVCSGIMRAQAGARSWRS